MFRALISFFPLTLPTTNLFDSSRVAFQRLFLRKRACAGVCRAPTYHISYRHIQSILSYPSHVAGREMWKVAAKAKTPRASWFIS